MCWYCGCHTKITRRYDPVAEYAQLMMREIELIAGTIPKQHHVTNIHFGGGSPGMLRADDFENIMARIRQYFHVHQDAEIAIEIDPRGLSEENVIAYANSGVNRISLGVQDFDDKVLESVNRQQPFELSETAVHLFRRHGITKFNFDLLYGLPHQTPQIMKETIEKALSLDPDRISLFGYAHVPWMKKHMRLIDEASLPDKNMRYDLFETGSNLLEKAGYLSIGIDHFAKSGDSMAVAAQKETLHRNFQGYTTDRTDALIGIGASSIGKMPEGYVQNAVDMPHYREAILAGKLAVQKFCPISLQDKLHGAVIERLMCDFKVDLGSECIRAGFPENYLDKYLSDLEEFKNDELIEITNKRNIKISPNAKHIVRIICSVFDEYMVKISDTPRHAKAI
jgi:oxygen-independent coproporphyrinogen-3 oxidase